MSHFAFVAPPFRGHLDPMLALAGALRDRGHRVTLFGIAEVEPMAARGGCDFVALGRRSHPAGTLATLSNRLAAPGGLGLFRVMAGMAAMTRMLCDELPAACRAERVDAVVADQLEPAGALVAAHLGLPFVTVANALPIHREPGVPPPFTSWRYDPTPWGLKRNRGGYRVSDALMRPVTANIAREALRLGVPGWRVFEDCLSPLAEITQLVPALDFPRRELGGHVHPCGPLRDSAPRDEAADLIGDGRPLVFASLGTLQGGRAALFRRIAQACAELGLGLVLAHGGRLDAGAAARLPGQPVVRAFVPQRSLLPHVDLLVTNGGLNTVLDGAAAGVPMLVIPIAFEQGAIAARVLHAGIGRVQARRGAGRLRPTMQALIGDAVMRRRARHVADAVRAAGGVDAAADVIEAVLRTGAPVLRRPAPPLQDSA